MEGKTPLTFEFSVKRVGGIEPPSLAWKAKVLPLNYTRIFTGIFIALL